MTERPSDSGGLSSGDPLGGGQTPEAPPHESGLPGYTSPPPPGAGGSPAATAFGSSPMAGRYVLAGWWSRVGAQLIDGLIVGIGALVLFLPVGAALGVGAASGNNTGVAAAIVGFLFWGACVTVIVIFYAPAFMARTNGKTLGRMAMNIRVVRTSGEPVTFGFAMIREVVVKVIVFWIAGLFTFGLAGLLDHLWPLWDEENRALHDFICSTRVVKD